MLETGYLKSSLSRNSNNLFGLYNSRRGEFFKFNRGESISSYKIYRSEIYSSIDYLVFLDKMGYAQKILIAYFLKGGKYKQLQL